LRKAVATASARFDASSFAMMLLNDYSDVSLSAMGFPDDWRKYVLWK
jgi:hypothetical protein